jgi:hypothetical protein
VAGLFAINASTVWFIDRVAHIFYVWLMVFYWMVGGLILWTVVLPQTRHVWFGALTAATLPRQYRSSYLSVH